MDRALLASLRERYAAAGQAHVFRFLDELPAPERAALLAELAAIDLDLVGRLGALGSAPPGAVGDVRFEPPETFPLERDAEQRAHAAAAVERGRELLSAGRVGFVLVAGGQASRLGFDGPKGLFPLGPVTGRVLFAYHARRLAMARRRFGAPIRWYVMTSPANDSATREAFAASDAFGLGLDCVHIFPQAMLPALGPEGEILMAAKHAPFLAPNGHGGVLAALAASGALDDARRHGIDVLSTFQVDNPLVRPADPLFVGLHALAGAEMSTKVVAKREAAEKVGVIGKLDGRLGCIEYSDLPADLREARDASGRLRFSAGNIAVHLIDRAFIERLTAGGLQLPWHSARKRMRVLDAAGNATEVEGTKFETFVFDALASARASVTLEVDRALEFSPVKNAVGSDSPQSAREDLCRLWSAWLAQGERALPAKTLAAGLPLVEIDPLLAEDAAEFRTARAEPREHDGGHVYEAEE